MYEGAVSGIAISVSLAFVILLFATLNVMISIYAIMAVGCICSSVVGLMVLLEWQMGVSESIAMVIIIGFSVDYVVHLAAHYVHSAKEMRTDRATEAIRDMGISIFSGAVTTLGSGIFLYNCNVKFFVKFATIMVSTVSFSLIYAFFFFMALAHAIGPQGKQGSITHCLRKCRKQSDQKADA
jgi:protein dispatched 1